MTVPVNGVTRCKWCNLKNSLYVSYHDTEWCVLKTDDAYLFEILVLESFQAGLSWECILNKREAFRKAFDNFDPEKVASFGESKVCELAGNKEIVRNRRKIEAAVGNAAVFRSIAAEFGSFYGYLLSFTGGKTIFESDRTSNPLSDAISEDLKKRGMKFVGTVIIYSYLQAIGVIYSHEEGCFLHRSPDLQPL